MAQETLPAADPRILEIHKDPAIAFGLRQPVVALPGAELSDRPDGVTVMFPEVSQD